MKKIVIITAILLFAMACQEKKSFDDLMTFSRSGKPHFIVVNPAGTIEKYQYDHKTNGFRVKTENGDKESLSYLPFPANFGFFPSTHSEGMDKGDLLYGFMISDSYSIQTMLETKPIGALSMVIDGKEHQFVFCIPEDESLQLDGNNSMHISSEMKNLFENWLVNGFEVDSVIGWHDAAYASELIKNRSNR